MMSPVISPWMICIHGAVANLGAIALENARLNESVEKDYEALRLDISEWRAALGWEWMAGESVTPVKRRAQQSSLEVKTSNNIYPGTG